MNSIYDNSVKHGGSSVGRIARNRNEILVTYLISLFVKVQCVVLQLCALAT